MKSTLGRLNDRISVGLKIGLLLGVMLLVAAVNVGAVYHYQSQVSTLGHSVNVAGEQRMLSQRMARYANTVAQSGSPKRPREKLAATMKRYDRNLEALRGGGTVDGRKLRPAPASVRDELRREAKLWAEYRSHVQTLLEVDTDRAEFKESLLYVNSNSDKLLQVSDELTTAFATTSSSKIAFMKELTVVLFGLNLVVFAVGTYMGRRYIGTPIEELSSVAESLARGRLDADVDETVSLDAETAVADDELADELKQLVRSFAGLEDYLTTVADQAEALANQDFDADVLEEEVPGEFGRSLGRMQTDLRELVGDLEGLNRRLEAKAGEYQRVMEAAADGDLSRRMDPESESEAMVRIAETFNGMMDDLEETIREIDAFADEVATSSRAVATSTDEVRGASEQVSESVQEISAGTETQTEHLGDVADEMQDLSGTVEEIASSASQVATTAERASELGRTGRESATDAIEEMNDIQENAEATVDEVETLASEMDEIGEIVEMIADIAEQTNLLALNASVEAARAGEAGEGFAVVADEIKSLANEAAEATDEVEALITDIQSSTDAAVEDIQETGTSVSSGTETVEDALQALEDVADHVDEANRGIQEISDATDDQAASTEEVVSMVDEVANVAEQTSTEAENVSAAAEEQTSSLAEVADSVQSLARRAEDLQEQLDRFTLGDREGTETSPTGVSRATVDGGPVDG